MADKSSDIPSTPSSEMEALTVTSTQPSSPARASQMIDEVEKRYELVRSIGEECIHEEELKNLLSNKASPICYDGFEPSGRMHIAQGIMKVMNVNKLTSAGCRVKILIADLFALMNNKMGGDLKKIKQIGEYLIETWKVSGLINQDQVEFLWSSDEINARAEEYWPLVMDIACKNKLSKIKTCWEIMGLKETDDLTAAQILYPCMQCADVFFFEADICQQGMDQKKVNRLARDYCDVIERKNKPIILSNHMLLDLRGEEKMSKSDSSLSAIFMDDDEELVKKKIKKAHCLAKIVEGNPCIEYVQYIVFPWFGEFVLERSQEHGGNKIFKSFEDIVAEYESGEIHPSDLKSSLANALNKILQPVHDHFKTDKRAMDMRKQVQDFENFEKKRANKTVKSSQASSSALGLQMSEEVEKRFNIVRSIGEECIQEEELKNLLAKKATPICYDGFEPSGKMHIAQGIMKVINVNKLTSAGCRVKILVADWFAQLNNKMGGDLSKIKVLGEYFIEIWKAAGLINEEQVEFIWASDEINTRADKYWPLVIDIARRNTLSRILRCVQIMGRSESDELTAAQILYPCMQCADIFYLEADICQLGMDQRKINVLAREYCDDIKRMNKPIILSHHILPGLIEGQEKMSKSNPSSAIFMNDDEETVRTKIGDAYCPERIVEGNPCLEYVKYMVFPWFGEFSVKRKEEHGSEVKTFKSFEEMAVEYEKDMLDRGDVKNSLAKALNEILQPVRDHFENDERAKNLLKQVEGYKVTR